MPCRQSRPRDSALTLRGPVHTFRSSQFCGAILEPPVTVKGLIMAVGKTTDASFDTDVLKSSEPVVVDFWAEWCGPCRMIAPALEEISGSLGDKVKIVKLNVDENPNIAAKYGIMSIPTLLLFKGGEIKDRQVGAAPKQKLQQWITAAV